MEDEKYVLFPANNKGPWCRGHRSVIYGEVKRR